MALAINGPGIFSDDQGSRPSFGRLDPFEDPLRDEKGSLQKHQDARNHQRWGNDEHVVAPRGLAIMQNTKEIKTNRKCASLGKQNDMIEILAVTRYTLNPKAQIIQSKVANSWAWVLLTPSHKHQGPLDPQPPADGE